MKKRVVLILSSLLFLFSAVTFAQEGRGSRDKDGRDVQRKAKFEQFKEKRHEYISKEMALTDKESLLFWPLCDELQEKKFELNRSLRRDDRKSAISESDYDKMLDDYIDVKLKEAKLDKDYFEKFRTVIPAEKVLKYIRAERYFARSFFEKK